MSNFALIGAAGYIAPKHMDAIKKSGNQLVAALDKSDSVGILDQYFPKASFFTEFERFDRHLEKIKNSAKAVDFLSVCSPNHLHDAHIRYGLKSGAHVICEKPLVLNTWNLDSLREVEEETGKKIHTILQLRYHPELIALKQQVDQSDEEYDVELCYITSRGNWYHTSWKGNESKSGGIATNIGIHFFDFLSWVFGEPQKQHVFIRTHERASGLIHFGKAKVKWFLSINPNTIPTTHNSPFYRILKVNDRSIDLSQGFEGLHLKCYNEILKGNGFGIDEAYNSLKICSQVRNLKLSDNKDLAHPFTYKNLEEHPFKQEL